MSWIPNFLSPFTGVIAAAIAIPALLVLYFLKLRRREMEVSSTLLGYASMRRLAKFSKSPKIEKWSTPSSVMQVHLSAS